MKLNELVAAAKAGRPKLFAGLDDKRIARLAQAILTQAGQHVAAAKEGKLELEGLGRFVVKQAEVTKEGVKVLRKRIVFRPKVRAEGAGRKKGGKGGKAAKAAKRELRGKARAAKRKEAAAT
jgi:hypothetical protein